MQKKTILPLAAMLIAAHVWAASTPARVSLSTSALTFNGSSGDVSKQPVTITATGGSPLVIRSVTFSSKTFSDASVSLPLTLSPGKSHTFEVVAQPATTASTGSMTIVTNAGTARVALAETATAAYHSVSLKWKAANPSTNVAHYAVDRAWKGASFYQVTDLSKTTVAWTDKTAKAGVTYQYRVRAVNSAGDSSKPSNVITVAVP